VRSGKSLSLCNLLHAYVKAKTFNLLYCISPTYDSNATLQTLPFEKDGIFTEPESSVGALQGIIEKIKLKNLEYKAEKEYKKAYQKWLKTPDLISFEQMSMLHAERYRAPKKIPWPCPAIFIDDMTHTELMSNTINNLLSHTSLKHRHIDGVGVSIFQAFQTFKSGKFFKKCIFVNYNYHHIVNFY